ncbi:MAG: Fic family protein [Paracoccaceae bacterium]
MFDILGGEDNPTYKELEVSNTDRHLSFLKSITETAIRVKKPFLSSQVLRALNYHAIACLHTHPGEYRPCEVGVGDYVPPQMYRVQGLMDDFINTVNLNWTSLDAVSLATFALWRLCNIHPFINGNGRTARAVAHFIICTKYDGWLPGDKVLPQLLKDNRPELILNLQAADESVKKGSLDLSSLFDMVSRLLQEQLNSAKPAAAP